MTQIPSLRCETIKFVKGGDIDMACDRRARPGAQRSVRTIVGQRYIAHPKPIIYRHFPLVIRRG